MADETSNQGGQSSSQGGSQQTSGTNSQQGNGSQSSQTTQTTGQKNGTQSQQNQNSGTQQTQVAARPAYIPEAFWDATAGKAKDKELGEHFATLTARVAADDVRKNSLPQKAEDYKIALPADFKPPAGIEFKFNDGDPLLSQARTMAHEMGLSQENFSRLLGLYGGAQVASQAQIQTARDAEVAKLGTTGPARVTAVTTFLKAFLGDAEGAQLASRMFTARDVEIVEKLITKVSNQGGASFRGTGREPPQQPGRATDEQYKAMTPAQRLDYSRQFDQRQFQKNGSAAS